MDIGMSFQLGFGRHIKWDILLLSEWPKPEPFSIARGSKVWCGGHNRCRWPGVFSECEFDYFRAKRRS
ncbi:AAEL005365-PA [Aedes aegypti]|uniref:AAEL005365-PA n=1 Tax=Aedes aegypti TaxID=7159 RepID=Q17AA6_AEDAE|nr:AAEL005365-PA [Aedes aegypti]